MEEETGSCSLRCSNAVRLRIKFVDVRFTFNRRDPKRNVNWDVAVVGAGIGGLATALALSRRDWPVRVVERSAGLSEAGAGMQNLDP
jgi:heterodisulfide reductase subunit A-like polyferredoxin